MRLKVRAAAPVEASEARILMLLTIVQFVNIVDFMMVMPLGPDFARALGISTAHIGIVGGSYTLAAAVAGLGAATFLDRFSRRTALVACVTGLALGTLAGALATGYATMLAARVTAGAFGGTAAALAIAIVSDVVPPERRGRAFAVLMGAFSLAAVLGVPAGLEVARIAGWRAPFIVVGLLGVAAAIGARLLLPDLREHTRDSAPRVPLVRLLGGRLLAVYAVSAAAFFAAFLIIPNISAFLQFNRGYAREQLGLLYAAGGLASFVAMRVAGQATDRRGPMAMAVMGSLLVCLALWFGFVSTPSVAPVLPVFVCFMTGMAVRNVALTTFVSRVPRPQERAGFLSVHSAGQHLASSAGAMAASVLLTEGPKHALVGMPQVALMALALTLAVPIAMQGLAQRVAPVHRSPES